MRLEPAGGLKSHNNQYLVWKSREGDLVFRGEGRRELERLCSACHLLEQGHGNRGAAGRVKVERRSGGKDDTEAPLHSPLWLLELISSCGATVALV